MGIYFYPMNRTHIYYMFGDIKRTTCEESLEHHEYRVGQASRLLNIETTNIGNGFNSGLESVFK